MSDDPNPQDPPDWKAIAALIGNGLLTEGIPGALKAWQSASIETHGALHALDINLTADIAFRVGALLHDLEEPLLPIIAGFVAPILEGLFGADVEVSSFTRRLGKGGGNAAAQSIVDGFMRAIVGDSPEEIQPSDAGSKRIAAAAVQASLESTFNAVVPEMLSDFLPLDFGHFKELTELPEQIIRTLGVSRLVRQALRPVVQTCCATPATWHMNRLHRPTLLGAGEAARQLARGRWTRDQVLEELARQGYSNDRIEALLNSVAKFHSVSDVFRLSRAGQWDEGAAIQHLKDQGYEEDVANVELQLEKLKAIESFERSMADAAVSAYVAGRIDEGTLGGFASGATISDQEKAQYVELAHARRACAQAPLSPSEAAACVEAGILSFRDYRDALTRDGRTDDAVTNLELLLRVKIDDKKAIADHRAEQAAERAAEKAAREAAAAAKKAAADAKLALAQRGKVSDLEQAFVLGQIPIGRVQEVYDATYDTDTVGVLVALLQTRRDAYVAQQAAAAAAKVRAATRGVDVGQLDKAVLTGVLTLDQFRRRLADLGFPGDDADLLTATLGATLDQQRAADDAHAAAAAAAKIKHVDLGTVELLVRRGHRTLSDYRAVLAALGYDDIAQAALVERLQIQIDDDAAAATVRAAAAAKLQAKGLSLDQFRRAVTLGLTPIGEYSTFLLKNGFTSDAIATLVAELQIDTDEASAARARRAAADLRSQAGRAPLADLRRAARLGLIPVDTYLSRLSADGYSDDERDVESDLLTVEIADERAREAKAQAADLASPSGGLTLSQLAAAVKAGEAPIEQYRERAMVLGFSTDDADTLTRVLQDAMTVTTATDARVRQLAGDNPTRELARADMATAVKQGLRTMDDYGAWLLEQGYADDDAALLVAELQNTLDAAAAKAAGGNG